MSDYKISSGGMVLKRCREGHSAHHQFQEILRKQEVCSSPVSTGTSRGGALISFPCSNLDIFFSSVSVECKMN